MSYENNTKFNNFFKNKIDLNQKLQIFEDDRIVSCLKFRFLKLIHIKFLKFLLI